MDKAERTRLKQLANDAIIATYGYDNDMSRLAVALEGCIDELEERDDKCPVCSICPDHGDYEDESVTVDANEVLDAHKELTERVKALKEIHVELAVLVAEFNTDPIDEKLADLIEELEQDVLGIERCVIP